jgi:hypothetical protein
LKKFELNSYNSVIDLESSNRQRFGHEAISSHVEGIERIYSESNIRIGNSHQLFDLLGDAKDLAAQWHLETVTGKVLAPRRPAPK